MKHKKNFTPVCLKLLLSLITLLLVFTGCGVGKEQTNEPKVQSQDTAAPQETVLVDPTAEKTTAESANEVKLPNKRGTLSEEMAIQIKQDYIRQYEMSESGTYSIHSYGVFGDAYVMYVSGAMSIQVPESETVAGFHFYYSCPLVRLKVYHKGAFYTLSKAYESNILSEDEIATVYENYTANAAQTY